jgi:hypothetical protein
MPTTKDNEQTTTQTETKPQPSNPPAKQKSPLPAPGENPPFPDDPQPGGTVSNEE